MSELIYVDEGGAAVACLSSVAVLSALLFYLRYYTGRLFFASWGAAWLFYGIAVAAGPAALWGDNSGWRQHIGQWSMGTSAVLMLWGALRLLEVSAPHRYLV